VSTTIAMTPIKGSCVLVAGGCGGMGRAFLAEVLALGLDVAVLDLPISLESNPPPKEVLRLPCDVLKEEQITAAFRALSRKWPKLRYFVNFIGFTGERRNVEEMPTDVWDEIVSGTLRSAFLLSREALPLLRRETGSAIVHFASTVATSVVLPGISAYAAAKAGLMNLVRSLSLECAPDIRVNAVAPGVVRTPFLSGGLGRPEKTSQMDLEAFARTVPLRRIGEPVDMVGPALFLLSPAANYITGQMLHVNGGVWA
jgi:NAD(P)-dependent dehydrogenase (short-subunit alcohol dehydrogenase family)